MNLLELNPSMTRQECSGSLPNRACHRSSNTSPLGGLLLLLRTQLTFTDHGLRIYSYFSVHLSSNLFVSSLSCFDVLHIDMKWSLFHLVPLQSSTGLDSGISFL